MVWTAPRTYTPGETLTASTLNSDVRDNLRAIGGAWTPYTPAWTATTANPTLGNGALSGRYLSAGALTMVSISLTIGSTTAPGSGVYFLGLPVPQAAGTSNWPVGQAFLRDASATPGRFARTVMANGGTVWLMADDGVQWAAGNPFPLATGDQVVLTCAYEAE